MKMLTLTDLTNILRECAGEGETIDPRHDIVDIPFDELGYDSLALLETASRIQRIYGARLDDDAVTRADTPRVLLDLANRAIAAAV
jgi:act minimal PKS acyl carrier protein